MGKYSIKDLERLSGIKAHTIRIWEQRYSITDPDRTDTNIRSYSDEDLRKILNVALLNKNGFKISSISKMSDAQVNQQLLQLSDTESDFDIHINTLTLSLVEMDEDRFEKVIATNTLRIGFEKTMINILIPFLQRIGLMWQTGAINPAQEHFISNLIRQKIIVAIDGQQNAPQHSSKSFLLFCPEGELHEIPLLFTNYLLRVRGFRVIYLGISVPLNDLINVAQILRPDFLLASLTSNPDNIYIQDYIHKLLQNFKKSAILLTGHAVNTSHFFLPKNVHSFKKIEEILKFLNSL